MKILMLFIITILTILSLISKVSSYEYMEYSYSNDNNETHNNDNYTYNCEELYYKLFVEETVITNTIRKELSQMLFQLCYSNDYM